MTLLLNTIALDPNRWTAAKRPYYRLVDLLPRLADAGFFRLEVWQYHLSTLAPADVRALHERAKALEITMPVVGLYPVLHLDGREAEREQAAMATVLADAAMLGARVVKCFAGRLGSAVVDAAAYDRSVAFTRALADEAARHGLVLTAETHPDTLCDTVAACRRFLQDVRAPNLRLCYQPFDFTDTDRTVADYEALRDVVVHVHLQGRAGDRMVWLEDADIAYGSLIDALAADGFEGFACIEFVKDCVADDPADFDLARVLANAGRDRAFIHGLAAQAGLTLED